MACCDQINFDNQLEHLFLKAFDGLRDPLVEQMERGEFDEEEALLNVAPVFDQLDEILGDALKEADSYIPSATDLGVDIVESIFDIDVQQSIEHLLKVSSNPDQFDVVGAKVCCPTTTLRCSLLHKCQHPLTVLAFCVRALSCCSLQDNTLCGIAQSNFFSDVNSQMIENSFIYQFTIFIQIPKYKVVCLNAFPELFSR